MNTDVKKIQEYSIPFLMKSRIKWHHHLLYILLIVIFATFVLIPMGKDIGIIILKGFFMVISIFFIYFWFYNGILRKQYLELTQDDITIKSAFGTRTIKWNQVNDVQVFTQNHNTMLGIILKEKVKNRKQTFWNSINDMYGGMFSVRIVLSQFPDINIETLYSTMINKLIELNENSAYDTDQIVDSVDSYIVKPNVKLTSNNFLVTIIKLLLLSIGIGLSYGLSIYMLHKNIVIIPILGSMAIIYFYSKLYKEEKINIFRRIPVGLICALQVFLAVILACFLESGFPINMYNIVNITKEYFSYLASHLLEQGINIFISILCFGYGLLQGYKFKFQKKIEKIFMKKAGAHYYVKEERIITIYIKDPELCNGQDDERFILEIYEGCLIEKEKKRIKGFCIPIKEIDDSGIVLNYDDCISISDIKYYKIDLNGNGNYQQYVFPCNLVLNSKKEVELIQIEI